MAIVKQKRPKVLSGETPKYLCVCGNAYITVNKADGKIFELFADLGKAGGCAKCQLEAIARCVSLGLRCGIPAQEFIEELKDLKCPGSNGTSQLSCPDAISRALQEAMDENK